MAHQTAIPGRPQGNLHLARGGGGQRTPAPLEGMAPFRWIPASFEGPGPSNKSPPRSRVPAPRAGLHLARGFPSARGTSPTPPTGALNTVTCHKRPGQRENPHHADPLTPPGNPVSALCGQPAIVRSSLVLCEHCAEWHTSFLDTVLPAPVLPPRHTPRKGTTTPSRSVHPPTRSSPRTVS
jgi:hypothetical protein